MDLTKETIEVYRKQIKILEQSIGEEVKMLDRTVHVTNVFIATGEEKSRVDFRIESKITSSFSLLMTAEEARYYAGLMAQNKSLKLTVDVAPPISKIESHEWPVNPNVNFTKETPAESK